MKLIGNMNDCGRAVLVLSSNRLRLKRFITTMHGNEFSGTVLLGESGWYNVIGFIVTTPKGFAQFQFRRFMKGS